MSKPEAVTLEPDYKRKCSVCDQKPVVTGLNKAGKVVYKPALCGVCCFGESKMRDPDNW